MEGPQPPGAVPPGQAPAELVEFVATFNREKFWESHEVLEGPWRESGSEFYHGLILFASAFVHVQRNNAHGIAAQLRKAEAALKHFTAGGDGYHLGLDVSELLATARKVRERVEEGPGEENWSSVIPYPRLELR